MTDSTLPATAAYLYVLHIIPKDMVVLDYHSDVFLSRVPCTAVPT